MSVLELQQISFSYGSKSVFTNCSLLFDSHERVALQALSGRGKTTLCRLLAGYIKPEAGQVLLDGQPLPQKGTCPVQLIWQHPEQALDPLLRMRASLQEAGPLEEDLLQRLGIKPEWLSRYPRELSGGEMQRFCIARALAVHPRFLIADEISTMLDALTQVQIWDFLCSYCEQHEVGLILVTHSKALQDRLATRVVNLDSL